MSTFCLRSYHRKCQHRWVGGQKSQTLVNVVCERPHIIFYGTYLCLYHKSVKPRTFSFSLSHRRTRVRRIIWPPTNLLTNHISEILIAELCCDLSKGMHFRPTIVRKTRWRWLKFRQKLIVKWTCHNLIFFDILQIAENGDSIPTSNLKNALDHVGIKLPMYRVRELLNDLKTQGKACDQKGVSKEVFREVSLHSCRKNNVFLSSENQQMTHW